MKLDSAESVFFNRQLEEIEAEMLRIVRPEIKARMLIPTKFGSDASVITYREIDRVGDAKVVSAMADDLPRVDVLGREYSKKVRMLGDAFGYTIDDIRNSRKGGFDLERERAEAAREVLLRKEDQIAALGSSADGLDGFCNNANVTAVTAPNDGTGSSSLWANKTPLLIVRDMNKMALDTRTNTLGTESPDTMLLSEERFGYIATTPMSSTGDSSMTILKFFLATSAFIKNVEPWYYLSTAGSGGTQRMVSYRRDPSAVKLHIPQDFTMLAPQERNFEFVVNCYSRIAGVTVYKPQVMRYQDGI